MPPVLAPVLQPLLDAAGAIFSSSIVQLSLRAIAIYAIILWIVGAYWSFRDMGARTTNPIAPYLVAAFVILSTPLLFPFAIIVYRIIRPAEKIGETSERDLAKESLQAELDAIAHCPNCDRRVDDKWIICPTCRTKLQRVCPNCSQLVGLDWTICAWCARDFERPAPRAQVRPASAPARLSDPVIEPSLAPLEG